MPNAFNRLTKKVKGKIAQRNYKYIIGDLGPIDSAFRDHLGIFGNPDRLADEDEIEDDTSTVSSFSTTATVDNNPGAGYTVDKYFYQPVGRRIERIAFQIALPFLPPGRIFQYIEENNYKGLLGFNDRRLLSASYYGFNSAYITGLSSLVYQTQSNSVILYSAALSALIRLCPTSYDIERFYHYAHNRVRNGSMALCFIDYENRKKKCYLLLETLSRVRPGLWNLNPVNKYGNHKPSLWKESLLKLVQSWRTSDNDAFATISEACLQFAEVINHLSCKRTAGKIELLYLFILFIIRFIPFIYYKPTRYKYEKKTQQLYHMLLSTFLRWLDQALCDFVFGTWACIRSPSPRELEKRLAIEGLLLHDPIFAILLPATTHYLRARGPIDMKSLPRNVRHSGSQRTVMHSLIRGSIARTQRLLKSIDELEREIRDSKSIPEDRGERRGEKMSDLEYTLSQARCVQVFDSDTNEEFLRARRNVQFGWTEYKRSCRMRHKWGIYLRSNLDWDWDTASCLERLFELIEEPVLSAAHIATVDVDAGEADTWNISTEATLPLPKKMKVAYKSATGEMKYETFVIMGQVANEQEVAAISPEQKGPEDGEDKGNNAGSAPRTTLDVEVDAYGDDRVAKDDLEEKMEDLGANPERQVDQVSICSLD